MTVLLENEWTEALPFDPYECACQVIEAAIRYENGPLASEVSVTLTNNASIREINSAYRQIDRETDVLSFPMNEFETAGDCSTIYETAYNPDTNELMLGDIIISMERAHSQAKEYGHALRREYAFLIAHSMLHLFGYDHMTAEEAAVMETHQEEILQRCGITRDIQC